MWSLIFIFSAPNPSRRTMAPRFAQPVTEMSTGRFLVAKCDRHVMLTPSVDVCLCLDNMGFSTSHNPIDRRGLLQG
jgi:hypothetical protein